MTTSYWQALRPAASPASPVPGRADVAVVGGGIAGVATALWLRRLAPERSVVLLEAGRLATGASGRNAGFLLQGTDADYAATVDRLGRDAARRLWRLTEETRDGLLEVLADADVTLERHGSYVLAEDDIEDERLRRSEALLREDGVAATYLAPEAVAEALGCRGHRGALFVPGGATLDPVRAVEALAERSGAVIVEQAPVEALAAEGGGVALVTARGALLAERVVLALNAFLPRLVPALAGVVRPVRAQMLATAPGERRLDRPIYAREGYYYLRQMADGTVLLGGARHLHVAAEVGYVDATTEPLQEDLEAWLRASFPGLAGPVIRRWSGTMGFSADGLPAVGQVPGVPGAWWVGGFTGHGMGYGFRVARTAAAAALGATDDYADLLDAKRLAYGR